MLGRISAFQAKSGDHCLVPRNVVPAVLLQNHYGAYSITREAINFVPGLRQLFVTPGLDPTGRRNA